MSIDPTARIAPEVELAPDVTVGPGVIIEGPSRIGAGTRILAHAYIGPHTTIGEENLIGFGAIVGYEPQDYAFQGEESYTIIGHHNIIREYATIHRGTKPGSATRVGNHNFLMALSHLAHNSQLGDHVIVVNGALVGGYVEVADRAFISANCVIHQFCRVGTLALMRGRLPHFPGRAALQHYRRNPCGAGRQPGGSEKGGVYQRPDNPPAPGFQGAVRPAGASQPGSRAAGEGGASHPGSGAFTGFYQIGEARRGPGAAAFPG